jgi:hypothetical protein
MLLPQSHSTPPMQPSCSYPFRQTSLLRGSSKYNSITRCANHRAIENQHMHITPEAIPCRFPNWGKRAQKTSIRSLAPHLPTIYKGTL